MESLVVARPGVRVSRGWQDGVAVAIKRFDDERHFRREALVADALSRGGAPVPRVLDHGFRAGAWTLVSLWVDGRSGLEAVAADQSLDRPLAQALAVMHRVGRSIDVAGCAAAEVRDTAWPVQLSRQLAKWSGRLSETSRGRLGGSRALERLSMRLQAIADGPPFRTVTHCDIALRNVIVGQDDAICILDFGAALIGGDPRYDLAKIGWHDFGGAFGARSQAFISAWAEATGVEVPAEVFAGYVAAHAIAAIAWVDRKPQPSADDHLFVSTAFKAFAEAQQVLGAPALALRGD